MENIKYPFTKQELMNELRSVLVYFAHEIGRVYQFNYSYRLLGLKHDEIEINDFADPFLEHENELDTIEIDRFWITPIVSQLYDYAFKGLLHPDLDWSVVDEDVKGFFDGLANFPIIDNNVSQLGSLPFYSIKYCQHVIELGIARAYLNGDSDIADFTGDITKPSGTLTLNQIALLADIDEKTVRNLAGPKSKQPLKTISVSNRTFVELDVARNWLKLRGQLLETVMTQDTSRDISLHGFTSVTDIYTFISDSRKKLQLSIEDFADKAELDLSIIKAAEAGELQFDPKTFVKIGQALNLNKTVFAKAALKTFQAAQLMDMEREIDMQSQPNTYGSW